MNDAHDSGLAVSRPESFQIKGALLPMSVLELRSTELAKVKRELREKVEASPVFFKNNPVVINFEFLTTAIGFDLQALYQFCVDLGLLPVGVKGVDDGLKLTAQSLGLAVFPKGKLAKEKIPEEVSESNSSAESYGARARRITEARLAMPGEDAVSESVEPEVVAAPVEPSVTSGETKVVKVPVRSGQQIFSRGDMVILAPVSAGAEVLAEGSIHIYGPLRGRALAGVRGNTNARVFCQSQEAELISIAGQFMIDENLRSSNWREPVQVYIENDELVVDKLDY